MNDSGDEVTARFRALLGRRYFVDREAGVLLVWLEADRRELAELVALVEARHPAARFSVQESGAGVAVRMSAREQDLTEIEARYVGPDPAPAPDPDRAEGAGRTDGAGQAAGAGRAEGAGRGQGRAEGGGRG